MKTNLLKRTVLALASIGAVTTSLAAVPGEDVNLLWYDEPAVKWEEALPVGNGRLSAMVFGHPANERLQLNEGTLPEASIRSLNGGTTHLRYGSTVREVNLAKDETYRWTGH